MNFCTDINFWAHHKGITHEIVLQTLVNLLERHSAEEEKKKTKRLGGRKRRASKKVRPSNRK